MDQKTPSGPYCYALLDDGRPFYVGKGRRRRMYQHAREARVGGEGAKCERIRAIWAEGRTLGYEVLGEYSSDRAALEAENQFLREIPGLLNTAGPRQPHDLESRMLREYLDIVALGQKVMPFVEWMHVRFRSPIEIRCYREVVRDIQETERFLAQRIREANLGAAA